MSDEHAPDWTPEMQAWWLDQLADPNAPPYYAALNSLSSVAGHVEPMGAATASFPDPHMIQTTGSSVYPGCSAYGAGGVTAVTPQTPFSYSPSDALADSSWQPNRGSSPLDSLQSQFGPGYGMHPQVAAVGPPANLAPANNPMSKTPSAVPMQREQAIYPRLVNFLSIAGFQGPRRPTWVVLDDRPYAGRLMVQEPPLS